MRSSVHHRMLVLWLGVGTGAMGCGAEVESVGGERSGEAEQAEVMYNTEHKLVLPLVMNKMGAQTGALPGPGWYTAAVIQNTTDSWASVKLTAYSSSGGATGSVTKALGPGENVVFRPDNAGYPGTIGIPLVAAGNFEGSMVVEADQRVAAVAQLSNLEQIGTIGGQTVQIGHPQGKASAFYAGLSLKESGFDTGMDLVYPTMKCGYAGNSTTLFVQNAGPTSGSARLDFKTMAGTTYQAWITLGVNESRAVPCSDFAMPACSGAACAGSVSIGYNPANIRFGAVAVEHATPPSPPSAPAPAAVVMAHHFHKKTSSSQAMHHAYCPVFKNQFQFQVPGGQITTSGIGITNVSSTSANIDVTLHGSASPPNAASGGTYFQGFSNIEPDRTVVASPWQGTIGGFPIGGLGWAEIHSTHPIVAQGNEASSVSQSGQLCMSVPDDELFVPLFKSGFPNTTSANSANTKVTLLNVGTQTANITADLRCRAGTSTFTSYTVSRTALPRATVELGPGSVPTGLVCSVRLSSPGAQLVGAVQESTEGLSIAPRDSGIYETIRFD